MSKSAGRTVLRCAIHVHTRLDDGDLPMEQVIDVARSSGVDVLMTTGHNHFQTPLDGQWEGLHDGVLVIIGTELMTRRQDHILGFGLHDRIATRLLDAKSALDLLEKLNVTAFVAHPQGRPFNYFFRLRHAWNEWDLPNYAGVEVWSYMHDWIEGLSPTRIGEMCREPERFITGPHAEVLLHWDAVAARRRVCGIGALDTHGKKLPMRLDRFFAWAREGILPYEQNFRAFSTYVPAGPLGKDRHEPIRAVMRALRRARCWCCHDALGTGRDFVYEANADGKTHPVGSLLPFTPGIELKVRSPQSATIRLYCRGEVVAEAEDAELLFTPEQPGEYRPVVLLNDRVWIVSNHIYLRDPNVPNNLV